MKHLFSPKKILSLQRSSALPSSQGHRVKIQNLGLKVPIFSTCDYHMTCIKYGVLNSVFHVAGLRIKTELYPIIVMTFASFL